MIYACTRHLFKIVLVGGVGDAQKKDIFVLNGQLFRLKIQHSRKLHLIVHAHQTSSNKNEIIAHPVNHGNTHFGPRQQPANNPAALVVVVKR